MKRRNQTDQTATPKPTTCHVPAVWRYTQKASCGTVPPCELRGVTLCKVWQRKKTAEGSEGWRRLSISLALAAVLDKYALLSLPLPLTLPCSVYIFTLAILLHLFPERPCVTLAFSPPHSLFTLLCFLAAFSHTPVAPPLSLHFFDTCFAEHRLL